MRWLGNPNQGTISVTETVIVEVEEKNIEDAEEGEIISGVLEDEPTSEFLEYQILWFQPNISKIWRPS